MAKRMTTTSSNGPMTTTEQLLAEISALKVELAILKAEPVGHGKSAEAGEVAGRLGAEESLRESEERLRSVAEKSPSMIFIDQGGRIVHANPKAEEIMGYSVAEMCAPDFDFRQLIAPDAQELVAEMFRRHQQGEEVEQYEYAVICKNGRSLEVINNTRLIRYGLDDLLPSLPTDSLPHQMPPRFR
jgi:PAS domain S-box-containing protein